MDVAAELGLPGAEALLATWHHLAGSLSGISHPTNAEVIALHTARTITATALYFSTRFAPAGMSRPRWLQPYVGVTSRVVAQSRQNVSPSVDCKGA